jgi:hypothetical protein
MKNEDVMVLCWKCRQDYIEAGYQVRVVDYNGLKEECTKCNRQGFSYHVFKTNKSIVARMSLLSVSHVRRRNYA